MQMNAAYQNLKFNYSIIGAALVLLCSASLAFSEEVVSEGFVGRGVSKIIDGDKASARHRALEDAQGKAVLQAVCAQMPVEEMAKYFLTLQNLFFRNPGIYLQRFKIINEKALFDLYRVTIQGFVQQEILRHDLESMGIIGPEREKMKVLLMIAVKEPDQPEDIFWWSSNEGSVYSRYRVRQKLEKYFIERGSFIVNSFEKPVNIPEEIGRTSEPDVEAVCNIASQLGARVVVLGKLTLQGAQEKKPSSLESIQCDIRARVIDVIDRSVIVQAATYALGMHIDQASASADAIEKACTHLADQIIDKMYSKVKSVHDYIVKLTFDKPASETEAENWFDAFNEVIPEVEFKEIGRAGEGGNAWTASLMSPIESAAISEKIFEMGIAGFATEVVSINENVIELKVSKDEPEPPDSQP